MCRRSFLVVAAALVVASSSNAEYVVPAGFDSLGSVTISPTGGNSDEGSFNNAMNSFGASGGIIYMEPGLYKMSGIELKSNIHVRMKAGVVIEQRSATNVFQIDGNNNADSINVSIQGESPEAKAVIRTPPPPDGANSTKFRAVQVGRAENFKISNLMIEEHGTQFSTIMTNSDANKGTIEDITMTGSGPGWGLYQAQGGQNIRVKNLDGQGGYTLRLEQGGTNGDGIRNLNAENIINRNGRAGVLVVPKNPRNGTVTVNKVRTYGSQWAVQGSDGKSNDGGEDGRFEQVTITDVEATYGPDGAQFKNFSQGKQAVGFLPESEKDGIVFYDLPSKPTKFSIGPSFGVVDIDPISWLTIEDVKDPVDFPEAFEEQPKLITPNIDDQIRRQRQADPPVPVLPGDYDGDGGVSAADFVLFRDNIGVAANTLFNDFNDAEVGSGQYEDWIDGFGVSVVAAAEGSAVAAVATPEPTSLALLSVSGLAVLARRR